MTALLDVAKLGCLVFMLGVSPPQNTSVILRGTGEGGYMEGLMLQLHSIGGLQDNRGWGVNNVALKNLLHADIADAQGLFHVRLYTPSKTIPELSGILKTIHRIDRLVGNRKNVVIVVYFDALRNFCWQLKPKAPTCPHGDQK